MKHFNQSLLPSKGRCRERGKGGFLFSFLILPLILSRNVAGKEEKVDKNSPFFLPFILCRDVVGKKEEEGKISAF